VTRLLEANRSLLAGQPTEVGIAYGVAFALAVGFAVWAIWNLRYAESTT
jgi:hypothetical protein